MEEIQLKVEKAYPIDLGRGIIRLDPTALLKLQLSPGDIVEIKGKKKTTAKVWRADRQDWEQGIVRIDNFIRQNAGVSIGEKVTIKKVEAPEAKKIILALPESMTQGGPELQFGEHANEIIKRHILKRPVFRGDIIPIINSMSQPMTESLTTSQVIPLVAVETDPANTIVLITEATIIELRKKPVQGYEKATRGVTTYEDIGGLGQEIMRVREIIEMPMKHPELFAHLNIEPPKGV
ncbi:MAG: ATPase, partial [Methanosarcina sp.]|nr:ATPase [Methanosarcina sp.]